MTLRRFRFRLLQNFFVGSIEGLKRKEIIEWMDRLDKYTQSLDYQMLIITIETSMTPEYIKKLPTYRRLYILGELKKIMDARMPKGAQEDIMVNDKFSITRRM